MVAEIAPRTLIVFKDAGGIWSSDKFRPLTVSVSNLIMNLLMVKTIGLMGVVISTIVAMLFIGYPWLMYNVNKELFKLEIKRYLRLVVIYALTMFACAAISYRLCNLIYINNLLLTLLYRAIVCVVIPNVLFYVLFRKTDEHKYFENMLLVMMNKFKNQKKEIE